MFTLFFLNLGRGGGIRTPPPPQPSVLETAVLPIGTTPLLLAENDYTAGELASASVFYAKITFVCLFSTHIQWQQWLVNAPAATISPLESTIAWGVCFTQIHEQGKIAAIKISARQNNESGSKRSRQASYVRDYFTTPMRVKTTITEKVLLHGPKAAKKPGTVKGKKSGHNTLSLTGLEMEKERGISVTTSVMPVPLSRVVN